MSRSVAKPDVMSDIIRLNVGGQSFTTTRNTLLSVPDTFFTALLSDRMPSLRDDTGAYFIDRDPQLFTVILNYLRTRKIFQIDDRNVETLRHEAEFYGLGPLIRKLKLYNDLVSNRTCGGNLSFQSLLRPNLPSTETDADLRVKQIIPFDSGLMVVFAHYVKCYRLSDYEGWQCLFESEFFPDEISLVDFFIESLATMRFSLAIYSRDIVLWSTRQFPARADAEQQPLYHNLLYRPKNVSVRKEEIEEVGRFNLNDDCPIDSMFFIGAQLVAISKQNGRVGICNTKRRWFVQDLKQNNAVSMITAFDKAESDYLFLCSQHGIVYLIDMQKFPLRLKDHDLLINEFYKDPENEEITAISCFHCSSQGNEYFGFGTEKSIEIAYGTRSGTVRILVHHPETVGQGPQLFQTIQVHLSAVSRITLNNEYLITVCDKLHVRTWSLVRFRGLISTQPGTKPHSSYKIRYFGPDSKSAAAARNVGPYGHQREGNKQVIAEMPYTDNGTTYANILYAANGQRLCRLQSVDGSPITRVAIMYQHDVRYRQFIVTGHENGNCQVWDLTTVMEQQQQNSTISREDIIKELFEYES